MAGWQVDGFHNFFSSVTAVLLPVQLILQLAHKQIGARGPISTTQLFVYLQLHGQTKYLLYIALSMDMYFVDLPKEPDRKADRCVFATGSNPV